MMSLLMLTLACVTVNVYFPAAEVQDAADQIVGEIHGGASDSPETSAIPQESMLRKILQGLPVLQRQAYAQADINVTTPNIRALKQAMKERFGSLRPLYEGGVVGEGKDGLLVIRSIDELGLKEKAQARKLVKAENEDRKELYSELAEANDIPPDLVSQISKLFANSWRKDAEKGWWIQNDDGEWIKKGSE
jgi:uncharacterized protein YdbL (DUF1318 family)